MDADIDEELAHYILNLMDVNDIGFIIASDIKRMVFFSDYTTTMNEYNRQQKMFAVNNYDYIDNER